MKDTKKFWLIMLGLLAIVILLPAIVTALFMFVSNWVPPVLFIGAVVIAAAAIAYKGGIGR